MWDKRDLPPEGPSGGKGLPLANELSLNRRGGLARPADDLGITLRPKRFSASAPSAPVQVASGENFLPPVPLVIFRS